MSREHRPGAVFWIDHYVVPTNDLPKSLDFIKNILGGVFYHQLPLTTKARQRRVPIGVFSKVGHYHSVGSFLQDKMLPPTQGLGKGTPRHGYFVRAGDIDKHLRRLDQHNVPHTDPIKTSVEGEEGTAIYFEDPDGNQYEFWAPRQMPAGAMEADNPTRIGRISHVVLESRDLSRTAEFYGRFLGVDPIKSADVPKDKLALRLVGGGRIIYQQVDELDERTGGHNVWYGHHRALTVMNDEFMTAYKGLWDNLPESEYVPFSSAEGAPVDEKTLPPRTELHGQIALGLRKSAHARGTYFYDWDNNAFHFVGGTPLDSDMTHYDYGYDDTNTPFGEKAQS